MNNEAACPASELDKGLLQTYLRLTHKNCQKVPSYLSVLKAHQCTLGLPVDSLY